MDSFIHAESSRYTKRLGPRCCAGGKKSLDVTSARDYLRGVQIGQAIREAREAKGWSQVELAARLKVAAETVCRWETGSMRLRPTSKIALESILGPLNGEGTVRGTVSAKRARKS